MSVLTEIVAATRHGLAQRRADLDLDALAELATARLDQRPPIDVSAALRTNDVAVIAEIKRRSPSAGDLADIESVAVLAAEYERGGASMVSVLTEPHWFKGSMQDLHDVRAAVSLPVLRKDFIVDELQIIEACAAGADAVLVIVAALSDAELEQVLSAAKRWKMAALVEVHDIEQAQRAAAAGAEIVGVNARNLDTLHVDTHTFEQVVHQLPAHAVKVAESGLRDVAGVVAAVRAGADAVLIGQALVQSARPRELIASMKEAARDARRT